MAVDPRVELIGKIVVEFSAPVVIIIIIILAGGGCGLFQLEIAARETWVLLRVGAFVVGLIEAVVGVGAVQWQWVSGQDRFVSI